MGHPDVRTRRWTRVEYDRLVELGVFQSGERLELVDGLLVVREIQSPGHATAIQRVEDALGRAFGEGSNVRTQLPIALDDDSEPEPDVAVVPGHYRDYAEAHPSRPARLVEVAQSSLSLDRAEKASLYARAGVPE
jgi:hypothetical protein